MAKSNLAPMEVVACLSEKESIRVLHVDDEPTLLKVTKECLEMEGSFKVDTTSSVDEALKKMKEEEYDAVVSDYQMPRKDGLEFLKQLRKEGNDIPFILLTGKGREEIAIEALNLGADRYLNKIVAPEILYYELAHAIRQAVDRKSAQTELFKREAKLNAILESSPEAITVIDLNGTIIDCNQATLDVHGYTSKSEVIGKHSFNLVSEKDHKRALEDMKRTFEQGSIRNIEYTATKKDGSEFHIEISGSVIRDPSGNLIGFVSITKDITERKEAEREIRIKDAALASSIGAVAFADLEGNLAYVNNSFLRIWGYANDKEVLGRPAAEFWLAGEKAVEIVKAVNDEGGWIGELTAKKKDGSTFEVQLSASLVKDETGKPLCMMGSFIDVTERRKAEQKLKESEEKNRSLVELAPDGILAINIKGIVTSVNHSFLMLLGYDSEEEIVGKPFMELKTMRAEDIPKMQEMFKSLMKGESSSPVEFLYVRRDGTSRWAEVHPSLLVKDGNPVGAQVIMRDVSERKKAEEELRESEGKFKGLVESTSDWIWQADKNGVYTYASPKIKDILGYEPEEVVGKTPFDFMPKDEAKRIAKLFGEIAEKKEPFHELENWNVHKNGTAVLLETGGIPIFDQKGDFVGYRGIDRDVTRRKKTEAELRRLATIVTDSNDAITVVDMDGRISAWNKGAEDTYGYRKDEALGMDVFKIVPEDKKQETLDVIGKIKMNETVGSFETKRLAKDGRVLDVWLTVTKLVDYEGNVVALATTERDMTEKKRLEERLRFSEKFTVLGQLASSVAHEIRNPLGVIKNSVYFLNVRLKDHADEKVAKHLKIMEGNVNSADHIISDLLDLARNKVGVLELVDLNRILERAFASLSVPENMKVITKLDKIPKMMLDPEHIQRVFVNIIQNAVAAMPKGGKLTVGISRYGDSVEISFKDSGVGIPEENMQKLFTPLFTTKAKGLGLGLAICKQIVEGHQGDIVVKSKVGDGALFIVRLPILSGTELVKAELLHADVLIGGMSE